MGKGSNTTSSTSSTSPAPQAAGLYNSLLNRIQGVANTPYQAYTGQLVAPTNAQQQAGIANINANANYASPYVQHASGLVSSAANPLTQSQIQSYYSPYVQNVVNATQAQFNNQNAQQQAALTGNTISQGALGGNRAGVAQGVLAGQQQLAQAPVIANLENQGYQGALQTAAQQYQQNPMAAAGSLANFGLTGQMAAMAGANAQIGAGNLEQQTQQAQDTAAYNQFQQQQAYPFQTAQWLASLGTGVGSQLGTTSNGQTTGPSPSLFSQIAGLGLAGLSLIPKADGGAVHKAGAGGVGGEQPWAPPFWLMYQLRRGQNVPQDGVQAPNTQGVSGRPYGGVSGYVPTAPALNARSPQNPSYPRMPGDNGSVGQTAKDVQGYADLTTGALKGLGHLLPSGVSSYGGASMGDPTSLGGLYARGGGVAGYADGGDPSDDDAPAATMADRFAPVQEAIANGTFDPQGKDFTTFVGTPEMEAANRGLAPPSVAHPAAAPPVVAHGDHETVGAAPMPRAGLAGHAALAAPAALASQPPASMDAQAPSVAPQDEGSGLFHLSPNVRQAMLAAGLGMMASRSPFPGVAIGEGGLAGLRTYASAQQRDLQAREEQAKIQQEAQRLQQQAQQAAENFALRSQTEKDTEAYRHEMLAKPVPGGQVVGPLGQPMTVDVVRGPDGKWTPVLPAPKLPPGSTSDAALHAMGISDDQRDRLAMYYMDTGQFPNLGFGQQANAAKLSITARAADLAAKDVNTQRQAEGLPPLAGADLNQAAAKLMGDRQAAYQGDKSYQRVGGTYGMRVAAAAQEVEQSLPLAVESSRNLPRGQFVPLNKIRQAIQQGMSNPAYNDFVMKNQALINAYVRAMNPTGQPRIAERLELHAENILDKATSDQAYEVQARALWQEVIRSERATAAARSGEVNLNAPYPVPPAGAPPAGAVPPPAQRGIGEVYPTPKGPLKWTGQGWVQP